MVRLRQHPADAVEPGVEPFVERQHAVATAVERIERRGGEGEGRKQAPFTLALGWYPTHVEFTLCRHTHWYFSHYSEAASPAVQPFVERQHMEPFDRLAIVHR